MRLVTDRRPRANAEGCGRAAAAAGGAAPEAAVAAMENWAPSELRLLPEAILDVAGELCDSAAWQEGQQGARCRVAGRGIHGFQLRGAPIPCCWWLKDVPGRSAGFRPASGLGASRHAPADEAA